jgi:hypothetical protein
MSKKIRYGHKYALTGEELMKLQELSRQLNLNKGQVVGLLIKKAQIVIDHDGTHQLADDSLVIKKGQSDGN